MNKTTNITSGIHEYERGQILLIVIMLVATVVTIVTTISFKSTTDTQLTKLQEDSQRTLAAAEAGIEKVIGENITANQTYVYSNLDLDNLSGIQASASQVSVSTAVGSDFVTPMEQKDQAYTFYLADYQSGVFGNGYDGTLTVYYGSEGACGQIALEMTVLSGASAPYAIKRYIADTGSLLGSGTDNIGRSAVTTVEGVKFNCATDAIDIGAVSDPRLIVVRTLFDKTRLGFVGDRTLKSQGRVIMSEAKSQTGVVKRVQLFQSLPQIPAEFFVTTF